MKKIKIEVLLFIFLSFTSSLAYSQEFTYELNGKIIEQPTYRLLKDDYLLNPDRKILYFSLWRNRFYGDINLNLYYNPHNPPLLRGAEGVVPFMSGDYQNIKFVSKFRPTVSSDEKSTEMQAIIDDAYLDIGLQDRFFLYAGKRNIRDGVGLGSNPTDFLGEGKEVDMTKREEERRIEREGNYLVGIDAFFKDITLTVIFAPPIDDLQKERDRFLLRANFLMETINTDMSLHYFNASIPGIGFNISTTIGESLVLHTESAIRWGSNRKLVKLIKESFPNTYEINDPDDSQVIYPHIVAGGHYTFKGGTNIICEYIYNGDGYDGGEWNNIKGFIKYSYDEYKKEFLPDLMKSNLLQVNSIMAFRQMRRNYIFVRVSNPEVIENTDGAAVFLTNADDKSFLIYPSVDYKATQNTTIALTAIIFTGENDTEFGMTHWGSEFSLIYKYFF